MCEGRNGKRVPTSLNIAERLPVDAKKLGEAFLGETGTQARSTDISPNDSQRLGFRHAPLSDRPKFVDIEYTLSYCWVPHGSVAAVVGKTSDAGAHENENSFGMRLFETCPETESGATLRKNMRTIQRRARDPSSPSSGRITV